MEQHQYTGWNVTSASVKLFLLRLGLYLALRLALNIQSLQYFNIDYLMTIWPYYAPYQSRLIKQWLYVELGYHHPAALWFTNEVLYAASVEVFRRVLLRHGLSVPTSEVGAMVLFVSSRNVGIDLFAVTVSVWLYFVEPKWAVRAQLVLVWVKEIVPVLMFAWYALDGASSTREAVKNTYRRVIRDWDVLLVYALTAGLYALVRWYFISVQLASSYKETLALGSGTVFQFYLYVTGDPRSLWDWGIVFFNLVVTFHVIWFSVGLLFRRENRDYLYLTTIFMAFVLLWAFVWEVDKVHFFYPWLYILFFRHFDQFFASGAAKVCKTNDGD